MRTCRTGRAVLEQGDLPALAVVPELSRSRRLGRIGGFPVSMAAQQRRGRGRDLAGPPPGDPVHVLLSDRGEHLRVGPPRSNPSMIFVPGPVAFASWPARAG